MPYIGRSIEFRDKYINNKIKNEIRVKSIFSILVCFHQRKFDLNFNF